MLKKNQEIVLVIILVLVSCCFWLAANAAEPPALAALNGAEKARVAKLIDGAKKEGKLVGYSSSFRPDIQGHLLPKFREWYGLSADDLQISIVSTRTDAIVTKVTQELRAKVYVTDIVQNATIDWFNDLVARGELMPYESPEYRYFCPQSLNPEISPTNPPYFIASYFAARGIVYNPKHVKGEIAHWKDLLRPEYKGKISHSDVSNSASATESYLTLRTLLGASFYKELGKQDPWVVVSVQDTANKAIAGEYPIIALGSISTASRANAGLELVFPPEGWVANGEQIAILTRAPHPNASKLFLDFCLSALGQQIILNDGYLVGRLGIKSKHPKFPRPIYEIKGAIPVDWRKLTSKDRDNAREEFRRLMIEKK